MGFLWATSLLSLAALCMFVYLIARSLPELSLRLQRRILTLVALAGLVTVAAQLRNTLLGLLRVGDGRGVHGVFIGSILLEVSVIACLLLALHYLLLSEREEISSLRHSANVDPLTSLHNQAYFRRAAARRISQALEYRIPLSLAMLDVDDFKGYNDRHGHEAGNEVLKIVAGILKGSVRADDLVARYGGEEFVVLLNCDVANAVPVFERVRARIEALDPGPEGGPVTASIGLSGFHRGMDSVEAFIETADGALYRAKSAGKNRVITSEAEAA